LNTLKVGILSFQLYFCFVNCGMDGLLFKIEPLINFDNYNIIVLWEVAVNFISWLHCFLYITTKIPYDEVTLS